MMIIVNCPQCNKKTRVSFNYGTVCRDCRKTQTCKKCEITRDVSEFTKTGNGICRPCINRNKDHVNLTLVEQKNRMDRVKYMKEMRDINSRYPDIYNL